jgi:hypothetical protein
MKHLENVVERHNLNRSILLQAQRTGNPAAGLKVALRRLFPTAGATEADHLEAPAVVDEPGPKPKPAIQNIGHSIQQLLGQEPVTHSPKPRQLTAEERERGYAAALRPDACNRKRRNNWQFKAR